MRGKERLAANVSLLLLLVASGWRSAEAQQRYAFVVSKCCSNGCDQQNRPGAIAAYSVNPDTGSLTPVPDSPPPPGSLPVVVTVHPSGSFAYVANLCSDDISAYTVDQCTGKLSAVSPSRFATVSPWEVAVDPSGQFLYAANGYAATVSGFSIDSTGALTPVPGSPFDARTDANSAIRSVQVYPGTTGQFVYAVDSFATPPKIWAFNFDAVTGSLTRVAGSPYDAAGATDAHSITMDPLGRFAYTENSGSGNISGFRIDPTTGTAAPVQGSPFQAGAYPRWVTVDPTGQFVYSVNFYDNTIWGFSLDPDTGALTPVPGTPLTTGNGPISVTATDQFVYVANELASTISGYLIDNVTGSLSELPDSPYAGPGGFLESVTTAIVSGCSASTAERR